MSLAPWELDMFGQYLWNMLAMVLSPLCEADAGLAGLYKKTPQKIEVGTCLTTL